MGHSRLREHTTTILALVCVMLLLIASSAISVTGGTHDQPGEPQSFYGTIETTENTPAPNGTEVFALVNGSVEDSITVTEPGQYGGPETLDERLNVNTGAGEEVVFRVGAPDGPQAAESPFELADATATPFELDLTVPAGSFADGPQFAVAIDTDASTLSATDGEELRVVAAIENVGDTTGTQSITATVGEEVVATEPNVSREPGANASVTLTFTAATAYDGADVHVASANTTDTAPLAVTAATAGGGGGGGGGATGADTDHHPQFTITALDPVAATVQQGDTVDIEATITNTGNLGAQQSIAFELDDTVIEETSVVLGSGQTTTVQFAAIPPAELDPATYEYRVLSADDAAHGTLTVTAAASDESDETTTGDEDDATADTPAGDDADSTDTPPSEEPADDDAGAGDEDIPGFGVSGALLAVVLTALIAARRLQ